MTSPHAPGSHGPSIICATCPPRQAATTTEVTGMPHPNTPPAHGFSGRDNRGTTSLPLDTV
jgi:hypothetical protein